MKKCSFIGLLSGIFICTGLLFTSCDNFLNGSLLKEKIEEDIEYQNAPSYTIRVEAEENTGTITLGAGGYTKKVTDSFDVGFKKNSGYKFIEWRAISSTDGSSLEDCIEFTDKNSLETKCRLLSDSNDIKILPFCESQISFLEALPEYDENGKPRDSAIKIIFSNELLEDNDFSKIKISIDGSNVDANVYFNEPEYIRASKTLQIFAKTSNRIVVPQNDTKSVLVTIPADFKYKGAKSGEILEIGEELQHSYRINYTTCGNANVLYGVHVTSEDTFDGGGTIKISGITDSSITHAYSIGQSATVTFKPADGFVFDGWKNSNEKAVTLTTPDPIKNPLYDERGFCESTGTATATMEVINEGIVEIKAEVIRLPVENINIDSKFGKLSPIGTKEYKQTDKITLTFNADSDYQFIGWKAFSDSTKQTEVPAEYISFENAEEQNTTFTLNKTIENAPLIYIEPVCVRRPKVVSNVPLYDSDGVYRDRSITIMFDTEMNISSVYWTAKELGSLAKDEYKITKDGQTYYYAYEDDSGIVFKNITIKKRIGGKNLLSYYEAPIFDQFDNSILRIKCKKGNEPPEATDILVTVKKEFSYHNKTNNVDITLSEDYSWSYYTNGSIDNEAPNFDVLNVRFEDENGRAASVDQSTITSNDIKNTYNTTLPNNNLTSRKLWVEAKISDKGGAGASSIKWELFRINDTVYRKDIENEKVGNGQFILKTEASSILVAHKDENDDMKSGVTVDLSEYLPAKTEGMYNFKLIGSDKNGNEAVKNFYFVYDNKGPEKVKDFYYGRRDGKVIVGCKTPDVIDFKEFKIAGSISETVSSAKDLLNEVIKDGMTNSSSYGLTLKTYDMCDNESDEEVSIIINPGFVVGDICYQSPKGTLICSDKYQANAGNPLGVIWKLDSAGITYNGVEYGNARIVDLDYDESRQLVNWSTWVQPGVYDDYLYDGRKLYDDAINERGTTIDYSDVYAHLVERNSTSPVIWYLPGRLEIKAGSQGLYSSTVLDSIKNGLDELRNNGITTFKTTELKGFVGVPLWIENTQDWCGEFIRTDSSGATWNYTWRRYHTGEAYPTQSLYMAHVDLR